MSDNDKYCVCGREWINVGPSTLFGEYYYCPSEDKIYAPTVEEMTDEWFEESYHSDRKGDMRRLALIKQARARVTRFDLVKLGLLDEEVLAIEASGVAG